MNTQEAIEILEQHNLWRRGLHPYENGGCGLPHTPAQLGDALTYAIEHMKRWQWQPIEICDPDTDVLLYCPEKHITNKERVEVGYYKNTKAGTKHQWATHFMPLPEPPQERKELSIIGISGGEECAFDPCGEYDSVIIFEKYTNRLANNEED